MDALGYDLAKIIEAAVTTADSVEPAKIREALANLENVQGATAIDQLQGRQRHADTAGRRHPHRGRQAGAGQPQDAGPGDRAAPSLDLNAAQ